MSQVTNQLGTELSALGQLVNNEELMLVHVQLPTDGRIAPHDHWGQDIFFTVVRGHVEVSLNEEEVHQLTPGTVLNFPGEATVAVHALEDSEFFVYLINRR